MVKKTLNIGAEVPVEESQLLDECKQIIDLTGNCIATTKLFEDLDEDAYVVIYIVQACWGFLRSIFIEWLDGGFHSAYILARAMTEYYIEVCFILKEDTKDRAKEYYEAWRTPGRKPYTRVTKFKEFTRIEARAKSVGLRRLYEGSYKSLCSFSHVDLRGSLIARRLPKFTDDRRLFLIAMMQLYLELLHTVSKKLNITYPEPMQELIQTKLARFEQLLPKENQVLPNLYRED